MNKININKANDIEAFRKMQQGEVSRTEKTNIQKANNKKDIKTDNLKFSNQATEFINFVNKLNELPDVREAKVTDIRQQIETGNFKPTSVGIADAIIKDEF